MQRRFDIIRPTSISAIAAIAVFASACGTTTTAGSTLGGEGASAADPATVSPVPPTDRRPDDRRVPTIPEPTGAFDSKTATAPTAENDPLPGVDTAPPTDPPTTTPVTIPPVLTPAPSDEPAPTIPPVTIPPVLAPPVVTGPPITIPPILQPFPLSPCAVAGPLPADASIVSEVEVDLDGDGDLDQAISFLADDWGILTNVDGVTSRITIDGVGPHSVDLLGGTDVASITTGDEILATVGGGPSTVNIAVIGVDDAGCVFQFADFSDEPLTVPVGATVNHGNGVRCAPGVLEEFGFDRQLDDTFALWSAGLHETMPGVFGYLPASDGFSEGLSDDELPAATLDCDSIDL